MTVDAGLQTRRLTGAERIAVERARQRLEEGYAAEHDDGQADELALAAVSYATPRSERRADFRDVPLSWPWHRALWKPTPADRIRELEKAGALIAAAIDAIQLRSAG